ncbi:LacI family transcriptional regulator [Sedimentitalea sp. CY04]|uniref:LacI family transcriptional regulator n=1 Tax=Parasedimentitalea denitrificans TaxID=2211118 RepID=A0ABX0W312_9RHOB|nr:LacI family DNA-binding transcriptional regulator [Sedimentitalea sp. CY04]NIZ59811.1 LacI family transcriptional regulator [Sedimentitalea sp. CY04]
MKKKTGTSFVSAQQVADLAGVSRSAVSRTFTKGASVSPTTRSKVIKAADSLGYHVNELARGLINEQSNIVCIVGADIYTPYQSRFIDALTRELQAIHKVTMVVNSSGDSEVRDALAQTIRYRADATLVLSGQPDDALIQTCLNNGQRVIVVNRDKMQSGVESIVVTNRVAAREAFHMLHRAGCHNIVAVSSKAGTPSLVAREQAFLQEAKDHGIEATLKTVGMTSYETGAETARQLFSGSNPPDGAFCLTDLLACGFMDVARHEFGRRIPEDLCVIGFDDIDQSSWSSYNLTTFRQPVEDIAVHIRDLLSSRLDPDLGEGPTRFPTEPVWRQSVRMGAKP